MYLNLEDRCFGYSYQFWWSHTDWDWLDMDIEDTALKIFGGKKIVIAGSFASLTASWIRRLDIIGLVHQWAIFFSPSWKKRPTHKDNCQPCFDPPRPHSSYCNGFTGTPPQSRTFLKASSRIKYEIGPASGITGLLILWRDIKDISWSFWQVIHHHRCSEKQIWGPLLANRIVERY